MEASELVPALRPQLHPAARALLLCGPSAEEKSPLRWGKSAPLLGRVRDLMSEWGFEIESAPEYRDVAEMTPEVVVFDGAMLVGNSRLDASANGHAGGASELGVAPDLGTLRALRALPELNGIALVALISDRLSGEDLALLQSAGADAFLGADASPIEVASRLQSAVELCRARVENGELRAQLTRQLRVDDVTGVMTRRYFFQQAHRECARARRYGHPLSCLMVEINHYRMLCARFGDPTGEGVLRSVATIIGQWTRDSDSIARFAEAKFVVLLPETDIQGATGAREKLLSALQEHPWSKDETNMPVSVSVGEAQLEFIALPRDAQREDGEELSEGDEMGEAALSTREAMAGLLEDADAALYIARKGARVPDAFVPHMVVENEVPVLGLSERR